MAEGVTIREAEEKDLEALSSLMTELGYPTSVEQMRYRFEVISADPTYNTLLAEQDGRVAGMAGSYIEHLYEMDGSCVRILSFVVRSEHRRKGIAP